MAKYAEVEQNALNSITNGTEIIGDINSTNDIRLDGLLKGNIKTKGKLVIGSTGKVVGTVTCKNSDVFGMVEGKLYIQELLSLKSTANIKGDIVTAKLAIEPGCKFTGTCSMDAKDLNSGQTITEKTQGDSKPV